MAMFQLIQDVAVKNKNGHNGFPRLQCLKETVIIVQSEIPAKPENIARRSHTDGKQQYGYFVCGAAKSGRMISW